MRVRESEKEKEVGNANKRLNGAAQLVYAIVVTVTSNANSTDVKEAAPEPPIVETTLA